MGLPELNADANTKNNDAIRAAATMQEMSSQAREAQMLAIFTKALKEQFDIKDSEGGKRFIDVSRVPLICQSIVGIHDILDRLEKNMVTQDQFSPVKNAYYAVIGFVALAVGGAILKLVLKV